MQLLENSMEVPQKFKHRVEPSILLLGTHPKELKIVTQRFEQLCSQSSTNHNSQLVEATQGSISG